MKAASLAIAISLLAAGAARALDELPEWAPGERKALQETGWVAGALLLEADKPADGKDKPDEAKPELDLAPPKPEEIAEDAVVSPAIPEEFLPAYFAARPESFLVDPQGLLSPADARDRLQFLKYHAGDSSIDLFVYVMGGDQEIPGEVRDEETIERFFTEGRPAAIVFYYLGAPQRSVIYLSPSLTDSIPFSEQHRALESSVLQAFERTEPAEQLDKFLVQMSIRLYWMERKHDGARPEELEVPAARPATAAEVAAARQSKKLAWLRGLLAPYILPAATLLGALLTASGMAHWLRLRARFRFPDFNVEPRMGGAHAAGIGAVISFASATVPPASQRDQVPDYLRRM